MPKKAVVVKGKSATAPGQMAKTTGLPAKSFAPGQLTKATVTVKKTKEVMAKGKGQAKVQKVMHEFKAGDLKSSSGQKVKSRDQAIAIAMSEAGKSRKTKK